MCIENDVLFHDSGVDRAFMNTFEPLYTAKLTAELEKKSISQRVLILKVTTIRLNKANKSNYMVKLCFSCQMILTKLCLFDCYPLSLERGG